MVVVARFFGVGLVMTVGVWFGVLFAAYDPAIAAVHGPPPGDCAVICMATEPIIVWPIPPPVFEPQVLEAPSMEEIRVVERRPD
jgi:hypothetical protein